MNNQKQDQYLKQLLNGKTHDITSPKDKYIVDEIIRCQIITDKMARLTRANEKQLHDLLEELVKYKVDKTTLLVPPTHIDIGRNLFLGKNVWVNWDSNFMTVGGVELRDRILIGPQCNFITANHDLAVNRRNIVIGKKIIVEEDVWIGSRVTVLPGVVIGRGSVIGASSVVTKSIPPYSVAAGNPAKVIKAIK